jgi:TonB family protein
MGRSTLAAGLIRVDNLDAVPERRRPPMRSSCCLMVVLLAAGNLAAQGSTSPPRLLAAELEAAPWNVTSGGIAAFDVKIDARGSVTSTDLVQDVAPYSGMLREALPSWRFEPAREGGHAVPSRVLVLGFFHPPATSFAAPENPRYKDTKAPAELPWPTSVVVPPYPPNALGSGKVVLEADISNHGRITRTHVLTPPTAFDSAASDSLRQWQFRPANRGNRDVASRAFFVFSFVGTTP